MADLNPIRIEDFPELTSLLSSDKVVVFESSNDDKLMPKLVELSSFYEFALSASALDDLEEKVSSLEKRYREIERELNNSYLTLQQITEQYSTISNFDAQINKIEKMQDFRNKLTDKADDTYLEFRYNALMAKNQNMKEFLGSRDNWTINGERGKGYKIIMAGAAKGSSE